MIQAIVATARRVPDAVALSSPTEEVSYNELLRRVGGVAHMLRAAGVEPGARVAIHLERGPDLIVAILGALACGAAYVPLDPATPHARLEQIVRDCRPAVLVGGEDAARLAAPGGVARLDPTAWDAEGPIPGEEGAGLAYIVYTSGSSGTPKGVMVGHAALANYLRWCTTELPFTGGGVPLFASISFDHAVTCYLPPLLRGETVFLLPALEGGRELARGLLTGRRYSYVKITPSHLRLLDTEQRAELGRSTSLVLFGGERLTAELVAQVRRDEPGLDVMNHYGPTEATVGCCVHRVPAEVADREIPIGRPLPGVTAVVRRTDRTEAAVDEPGELHIGGAGLSFGYWEQPELTARSFVDGWYRTGDLAVRRADGELGYLGRVDDQVKVLGHRVEPAEIEHVLRLHPQVGEAFVVADAGSERTRLVGAVTLAFGSLTELELRRHVRSQLPPAFVPSHLVVLERAPLTGNGKVDRETILGSVAPPGDEASSALESRIADGFADILGIPGTDPDDDFFEQGGDSLASVEALAWIEEELGVELEVSALFEHPTARALARHIERSRRPAPP